MSAAKFGVNKLMWVFLGCCTAPVLLVLAYVVLSNLGALPGQKGKEVKGPEHAEVGAGLEGWVAYEDHGEAYLFPLGAGGGTRIYEGTAQWRSDTLAGPDRQGTVALVANNWETKRHRLVLIGHGQESQLFERPGDALWGNFSTHVHPIGNNMAMSPDGKVAILVNLHSVQAYSPQALQQEGTLEIWGAHGLIKALDLPCLDYQFSWFPDGKRLAVVRHVSSETLKQSGKWPTDFRLPSADGRVGAVCEVNIESGESRVLLAGTNPVVSEDGRSLFLEDYDQRGILLDLKSGEQRPVSLPGRWSKVLAITKDGRAIYWGLRTEGAEARQTTSNSPLAGAKPMMTIKVADMQSGRFSTLVPYVDPRSSASFGYR